MRLAPEEVALELLGDMLQGEAHSGSTNPVCRLHSHLKHGLALGSSWLCPEAGLSSSIWLKALPTGQWSLSTKAWPPTLCSHAQGS